MTWKHGPSGYHNHGCRCRICRDGWAKTMQAYRQARKARRNERMVRGKFVKADPA